MSRNLAGVILVSLLMLSGVGTCLLAVRWYFADAELQRLRARSDSMARTSIVMQQLASEAIEYGRHHTEIHPLLNQFKAAGVSPTNLAPRVPPQPDP